MCNFDNFALLTYTSTHSLNAYSFKVNSSLFFGRINPIRRDFWKLEYISKTDIDLN